MRVCQLEFLRGVIFVFENCDRYVTRTVDSCCGSRALPQQMASLSTARRARRVGTLLLETHGVRHAHCALQSSHPDPDRSHQRQPDPPISLTLMQGSVHASVLCQ